jgi:hypothetical protein
MKTAHLENEINPFASASCAPYPRFSRKGHGLRSLLVLLDRASAGAVWKSLYRAASHACGKQAWKVLLATAVQDAARLKFDGSKRIDSVLVPP